MKGETLGERHDSIRAILWEEDRLRLLDQRRLPARCDYLSLDTVGQVGAAISDMVVRGAPAIGITAAYGVALAAGQRYRENSLNWKDPLFRDMAQLGKARPTAVNLAWALRRMRTVVDDLGEGDPKPLLLEEAQRIHREDIAANRTMGALGAALIEPGCGVLTHCNAGSLATGGYGTALGVIRSAYAEGRIERIFAGETRPWLQGARLTAWELHRDGIPVTLLADSAAASLLGRGEVGWVIVGADRIARNGDVANKIGTYGLAVAARYHGAKFMVVAPVSTIDFACPGAEHIPVEHRPASEVLSCGGTSVAPEGVGAWNPVFDVTPAALVDVIVTEKGLVHRPDEKKLAALPLVSSESPVKPI